MTTRYRDSAPAITIRCVNATDCESLLRFTVARTSNSPSGMPDTKKNQLLGDAVPSSWIVLLL